MTGTLEEFGSVFTALADPNRRLVLERLARAGEGTATTLAAGLPISRQAVVKHLNLLEAAHLVTAERRGRELRYSVQPARLSSAARSLDAIAVDWDRTLAVLKRVAEGTGTLDATPGEAVPRPFEDHPDR